MDGNHPKRRKDKYNPYTIGTTEDGRHWLAFTDGQRHRHHLDISAAVFALFDAFELDDLSYLNEVDRHYEQSELTEGSLYILVLQCADEKSENAAVSRLGESVKRYTVKSKTVSDGGVEMTIEVRIREDATEFVNAIQSIGGVRAATLVSYNGEYMS